MRAVATCIVLGALALGALAVASPAQPSPSPPSPPFVAAWDGETPEAPIWTQWLAEELESHSAVLLDFVPGDADVFCPRWAALDRRDREQIWIVLISAMAKYESGFDADASFQEPPPLSERSIGLLQLSLSDTVDFACGFSAESEIEDPRNNLDCAARVVELLVLRDGVIGGSPGLEGKGAAAYWAVLNERGHAVARAYIVGQTNALPACRASGGRTRHGSAGRS